MSRIIIPKPFDAHIHLRKPGDGIFEKVTGFTSLFCGGVIMGNTSPPIITAEDAKKYREMILASNQNFFPLMTIMLTYSTTVETLRRAFSAGVKILKFIPGNTSTGSGQGVGLDDVEYYYPLLAEAERLGMYLSIHCELAMDESGESVPFVLREEMGMPYLEAIVKQFPELRVVVEHVTTGAMVEYVQDRFFQGRRIAATITAHHPLLEVSDVIGWDGEVIDPFNFCLPVAKGKENREAVIRAMTSGLPCFFFGSDSAPHLRENKLKGAAGIFSHPVAIQTVVELFQSLNRVDRLPGFLAGNAIEFYEVLLLRQETITLVNDPWIVPLYH